MELLEACYFAFSNRLLDMARSTTCRCDACAAIGSLDLKFVAHYGSFMVERDGEREDLSGPDVIRDVRAAGAYRGLRVLRRDDGRRSRPGTRPRADAEEQREYIGSAEADFELSGEHPYPPAVLWQYFVDPEKRLRWQPLQTAIRNEANQQGRMGAGASSHCAHGVGGDALREYLDWRPFSYFSNRVTPLSSWPGFLRPSRPPSSCQPKPAPRWSTSACDSGIVGG